MNRFPFILLPVLMLACISSPRETATTTVSNTPIAFPNAEGYGKYATGGRGGKVFIITNLNDNGPGSLREAAEKKGPRIIVFEVSGTIHLLTPLSFKGDVTVAGQTAPGDGICLADQPVGLGGDNIIIQYLRFRMGDRYQRREKVNGSGSDDALGGTRRKHIIIDHCTVSWSTDEAMSIYAGDSTTLQWNLIAEPLNYSYHFETGDTDFERHGYGGIWGGQHLSAHHNLFAHCNSRTPRFNGARAGIPELADYRNNVIYNWGGNNVYAGEGGRYNVINNYYKPGPSTGKRIRHRFLNPYKGENIPFGEFYFAGNEVEGFPDVAKDNAKGVEWHEAKNDEIDRYRLQTPIEVEPVSTQSASNAFQLVLTAAGASFRRDTLDARIIEDVRKGRGQLIDVQGGFAHGTPYDLTVNAWPDLKSSTPLPDTDRDGMPDAWEKENGLDPNDPTDAGKKGNHDFYTAIERYIHSITGAR